MREPLGLYRRPEPHIVLIIGSQLLILAADELRGKKLHGAEPRERIQQRLTVSRRLCLKIVEELDDRRARDARQPRRTGGGFLREVRPQQHGDVRKQIHRRPRVSHRCQAVILLVAASQYTGFFWKYDSLAM